MRPYEDCCTIFTPSAPKRVRKREIEHFEATQISNRLSTKLWKHGNDCLSSKAETKDQFADFSKGIFNQTSLSVLHTITKHSLYEVMCFTQSILTRR
ncbi:hypothetical protein PO124_09675 [Bacillus licheniformis]|nr:hypothetical protein [Bacillus licheniformis]